MASFLDPIITFWQYHFIMLSEFGFSVISTKFKNKGLQKGSKSQSIFAYGSMKTQRPCLETKFMEINHKTPEV